MLLWAHGTVSRVNAKEWYCMNPMIFALLVLAGTPLYQQDPADVTVYLTELQRDTPDYLDRLARVVRDSVGTPYHDGPLGEGPNAQYDTDPLIDLSRVDCVTFVEQSAALAAGGDFDHATERLQQIRYAGGRVDFATRNHFTIADWIPNNPWCHDVTGMLGLPVQRVTRTISKADFFRRVKAPELGQDLPDRDVTIAYVPVSAAEEAAARITKPSLIVFIGKIEWLFALHCGIYLPDSAGGGALYHASSKAGTVTAVPLSDYVREQSSRYLGFTVYEISAPAPESAVP